MSQQQDFYLNWLDEESHNKYNMTMSEVSAELPQPERYLTEQFGHWDAMARKTQLRQRNKINAKHYREHRKHEQERIRSQISRLTEENSKLRSQKYCMWCHRSYEPSISYIQCEKKTPFCRTAEFEPFSTKSKKKGKIWMALGILLLVLGLQINGFKGSDVNCSQLIHISKQSSTKWLEQLTLKSTEDPFKVSMRSQDQFAEGSNKYVPAKSGKHYERFKDEDKYNLKLVLDQSEVEGDEVSFNRELIYSIQAQIDDIGAYI